MARPHARAGTWLGLALGLALAACTYDFDQFTAPVEAGTGGIPSGGVVATGGALLTGGAPATGGTPFATGGTLATGGSRATGGAPATGGAKATGGALATGGSPAPDARACAGESYGGICWYLGQAGESCKQACAAHGQTDAKAASYVGTSSQGGSLSECRALLTLLGVSGSPANGSRTDGLGLGCHVLLDGTAWWLRSPNFSVNAALDGYRLVCGCND
jgi:hypothetical protein